MLSILQRQGFAMFQHSIRQSTSAVSLRFTLPRTPQNLRRGHIPILYPASLTPTWLSGLCFQSFKYRWELCAPVL